MNTIFSFSRFGHYASTEFRATRSRLLKMVGLTAGIDLALILFGTLRQFELNSFAESLNQSNQSIYTLAVISISIAAMVMISHAFRAYQNPMTAPRTIMLPISQCEKFTFVFLFNVILIPALLFGTVCLVQTTVGAMTGGVTLLPLMGIGGSVVTYNLASDLIVDSILYCSIYLLGAAIFRRAHFVLTSAVLIGILMIIGWTTIYYIGLRSGVDRDDIIQFSLTLNHIVTVITYCMIPIVIFFTWMRFRTLQLKK